MASFACVEGCNFYRFEDVYDVVDLGENRYLKRWTQLVVLIFAIDDFFMIGSVSG